MNFYEFATNSPWLTFFLFYLILKTIRGLLIRLIRQRTIVKCGWPPAHLDADGDWKQEE